MPVTRVALPGPCQLVTFAGYQFTQFLDCPKGTVLELDIPFQRSPHYSPRLTVRRRGAPLRYVLRDGTWLPASSTAPSLPVGSVARPAAS